MAAHDPDGVTIASALPLSNTSMNLRPTCRASSRYPVLKAGCEQQVCLSSNWTSQPTRRNTSTLLTPTPLHSWSTKNVTKSETSIRFDYASETAGQEKLTTPLI